MASDIERRKFLATLGGAAAWSQKSVALSLWTSPGLTTGAEVLRTRFCIGSGNCPGPTERLLKKRLDHVNSWPRVAIWSISSEGR